MTVRVCVTVRHKVLYMKHNNNTQPNLIMHYISHSSPPSPLHPHTYIIHNLTTPGFLFSLSQTHPPSLPPPPPKKKKTPPTLPRNISVCQSGDRHWERREAESALYNINYHAPPSVPQAGEEFCAHALGSCRTPHWVRLQWCWCFLIIYLSLWQDNKCVHVQVQPVNFWSELAKRVSSWNVEIKIIKTKFTLI